MEAAAAERGEDCVALPGSLRWSARQLLLRAGEDTAAFREVGDRLDGKPAQAHIGGDDDDNPINIVTKLEIIGVRPNGSDSTT